MLVVRVLWVLADTLQGLLPKSTKAPIHNDLLQRGNEAEDAEIIIKNFLPSSLLCLSAAILEQSPDREITSCVPAFWATAPKV